MTKEDDVSFEIAKLLKEKGFDERVDHVYLYFSKDDIRTTELTYPKKCQSLKPHSYPHITHQMVMKWLREVHRIDIEVRTHYLNYLKPNDVRYYSGKILKGSEDVIHTIYAKDTYEEVCEAAIKYSLENLI